jgi:hypothetical protein
LFSEKESPLFQEFTNNALYKQIQSRFFRWKRPPSYMSNQTFSTILFRSLLQDGEQPSFDVKDKIDSIRNDELRQMLQQFHGESYNDVYVFRRKVETWYDEVMDRASGWYKRNTQFVLLVIGLFIAIIFNVDSISIYDKLSKDPQAQLELMSLTEQYFSETRLAEMKSSELGMDYKQQVNSILSQNLNAIKDPIGMGWDDFSSMPQDFTSWLYRILGWLTTALAVSLGAPFWFDLLKKIVNVRSAGTVPTPTPVPPYDQIPSSYGYASHVVARRIQETKMIQQENLPDKD